MSSNICECGRPVVDGGDGAPFLCGQCVARRVASPRAGILLGGLLLLTAVIPWGIYGDTPLWSWHLFNHRHATEFRAMLFGVWASGLLVVFAAMAVRGLRLAVAYLVAGVAALSLYLIATQASALPWRVFVPITTRHHWIFALAIAALAMLLTVSGLRARGVANVPTRLLQGLAAATVTVFAALAIRDGVATVKDLGPAPGPWAWAGLILGLVTAWFAVVGCALALLHSLAPGGGNGRAVAGRRLVLASLFLLLAAGIAAPAVESGALRAILRPLNGEILLAAIPMLAIEGLIGVLARPAVARGAAQPSNGQPGAFRLGNTLAATAALVCVVAVAGIGWATHIANPPQQISEAAPRTGDWPQWCGGPDRNRVSGERGLPAQFDEVTSSKTASLANVRWAVRLGNQTYGSPVVSGGKVFIGGTDAGSVGLLWCFRESDGKLLWRMRSPSIAKLYGDSFGITSTPTVEGDRVYLVGHLGDVLCLNANGMADGNHGPFTDEAAYFATGAKCTKSEIAPDGARMVETAPGQPAAVTSMDADILWRFDMLREVNCFPYNTLSAGLLIRGDRLYVATCSTLSTARDGVGAQIQAWKKQYQKTTYDSPSLIVLDKNTGKMLARDGEGIFDETFHGAHSTPALGRVNDRDLVFYAAGNGACYAFDAECAPQSDGKPGKLSLVWKFDCLDAASYGPSFRAERLKKAEAIATPVFYRNRIYMSIGNDLIKSGSSAGMGRLVCIDATRTGDITSTGRLWSFDEMRSTSSTVAIADGLLYTGDASGMIYCLDADTGKVYWTDSTAPIWGSPLVADGKVYVGTHNRGLLVFAHGKEKKLLARVMGNADLVASPAVAHGVLYLASQRYLYAVQAGQLGGLVPHAD